MGDRCHVDGPAVTVKGSGRRPHSSDGVPGAHTIARVLTSPDYKLSVSWFPERKCA